MKALNYQGLFVGLLVLIRVFGLHVGFMLVAVIQAFSSIRYAYLISKCVLSRRET